MLEARIVKARREFTVDVDFRVASGDACGIFGVSGAGKSTILSCIAGALEPDGGRIALDGEVLFAPAMPLHLRPIGYLTQHADLFPHLSVADNVRFGLTNGRRASGEDWVATLRERFELGAIWNEPAIAISGGQARRVALARMLARKPNLVLLDEPFNGLDRHLLRAFLAAVAEWQKELGFTLLAVDHEAGVLARLCPRAIVIEAGRIVQSGTWDELRAAPATPSLAGLLAPL